MRSLLLQKICNKLHVRDFGKSLVPQQKVEKNAFLTLAQLLYEKFQNFFKGKSLKTREQIAIPTLIFA